MDKADLLSRTCAYIGLLCSFIAFYFVLSYFDSPKKTAPTYTEITFTLQKDEPLIKQKIRKMKLQPRNKKQLRFHKIL